MSSAYRAQVSLLTGLKCPCLQGSSVSAGCLQSSSVPAYRAQVSLLTELKCLCRMLTGLKCLCRMLTTCLDTHVHFPLWYVAKINSPWPWVRDRDTYTSSPQLSMSIQQYIQIEQPPPDFWSDCSHGQRFKQQWDHSTACWCISWPERAEGPVSCSAYPVVHA